MDTVCKMMEIIRNRKGIAVIYIALILVVSIIFVGFAIDFGYMYVAKGQLQNAADAAALAGASQLTQSGMNDKVQSAARAEAITFVNKNKAAGTPIQILNNETNTLSDANDITVGNWNGTNYFPDNTPVNAIQVRTRRTTNSPGGQITIFFGKVLSLIPGMPGWTQMSAAASAVAGKVVRVNGPVALCVQACPKDASGNPIDDLPVNYPSGHLMYWAPYPKELLPADQGAQGIAWTLFLTTQNQDKTLLASFFCGNKMDACNLPPVCSTNSNDNEMQKEFFCAFKNPNYDSANKVCIDGNGECGPSPPAGSDVKSWVITVPVFENAGCPPGAQSPPYQIVKLAQIRVTDVYAQGGGGNRCACNAYGVKAPTGSYPNAIVIDQLTCISCGNSNVFGNTTVLLK